MVKKILITTLIIVLVSAVGVGAYDAYQGNSALDLPNINLSQSAAGGQGRGSGQGRGQGRQGWGQGQSLEQGQSQVQDQGQSQGQGSGSVSPQAMVDAEWLTLTGTVVSMDQQSMIVDTVEQGELTLQLGPPGFADEQAVILNPGDAVTILGFEDETGIFEAGQITNETTGNTLYTANGHKVTFLWDTDEHRFHRFLFSFLP